MYKYLAYTYQRSKYQGYAGMRLQAFGGEIFAIKAYQRTLSKVVAPFVDHAARHSAGLLTISALAQPTYARPASQL